MVQMVISSAGAGGLAEWVLMELQGEIEARYSTGLALLVEIWPHFQGTHFLFQLHQVHWLQIQHLSLLVLVTQAWLLFQEG
uniref:Uncharacterized protein n=1 Tax=Balaenoptera musculus TaxID=9771 RepID=A0A8C0DR60_BALMU